MTEIVGWARTGHRHTQRVYHPVQQCTKLQNATMNVRPVTEELVMLRALRACVHCGGK